MKLVIASNNAHKVEEIKAILAPYFDEILSLKEANLAIDVVEDGETFEENARKKAEEVLAVADADAALSDDSGLMVDALNGAPGVHSARYAGEGHDDAANNAKLLAAMQDVPENARACQFVSAIALARRGRETLIRRGEVEGMLLRAPRGQAGFGYDPLFDIPELGMTMAELTLEVKNKVSHRAKALEIFKGKLKEKLQEKNYADK